MRQMLLKGTLIGAALAAFLIIGTGHAFASHVNCGNTITQSTTLDSDLLNCPGDGVVIGAPNITLDLHGHTIDGDETGGPVCEPPFVEEAGIENPGGHDGITIRNGTIQEFGNGIEGGYGRSRMRNLTIRSNRTYGISIGSEPVEDSKDANEIERNRVTDNGCGGIGIFGGDNGRVVLNTVTDTQAGGGITFDGCNNTRIARNTVSDNAGEAIVGFDADGNSIAENTVSGNAGAAAILGFDADGNSIAQNTVSDNGDGFLLLGHPDFGSANNNVVVRNSATRNGGGVVIASSSHNEVRLNSLHDNFFVGVVVLGGDDNRIKTNSIFRNGDGSEGGIHLMSNDQGDGSDRTVVSGNTLGRNRGDGILVDPGQTGTVIDENRSENNSDDGIDVDDPATTVRRNTANRNGDLGIEAVAGVTDGGGNTARRNGNPAQCVNVRCN